MQCTKTHILADLVIDPEQFTQKHCIVSRFMAEELEFTLQHLHNTEFRRLLSLNL